MSNSTLKSRISWSNILAGLVALTIVLVFVYLAVRTALFFVAPYQWYEKVVAACLLLAELFVIMHSVGYFINIFHVLRYREIVNDKEEELIPELMEYPSVAILVASYHEPLDVLSDTLTCFYNLTYPNKYLYFLDDTRYDQENINKEALANYRGKIDKLCEDMEVNLFRRKWRGAKAGIINDFLDFIAGRHKDGFEFIKYDKKKRIGPEKYIVVFDADMNPFPDFVEPLVKRMEANPKLAFLQTPQYYSNFEHNRVAKAAGLQQAVFYEYICEGKSLSDAMFCCGTNVIFRRKAFEDVGGFDESSVTEDIATAYKFHKKGWQSAYYNKVCAFGMGPEDLGAYFKQQFRWALGTTGLGSYMLSQFLKNPKELPFSKWWEYFLSGTHYFVGWAFFIMLMCPVLFLILNIPSFFAKPEIYFLVFFPYLLLSLSVFFLTLERRKYAIKDLIVGQLLIGMSFPIFMKASLLGFLGYRGTFGITPKGQSLSLPLVALWPQVIICMLSVAAICWGINRIIFEPTSLLALIVNCFWCFYHLLILSSAVFYFNRPQETTS